jgi:LPPG:FO 2-phospho-L-lactate transferase
MVDTEEGELVFQEYFVHRKFEPRVKGFRFENADNAEPAPGVVEAVQSADAIIICPSNPWVSIDPILNVIPLTRASLSLAEEKPVFAVSPIIGGQTVKGPAAKMYRELGIEPSAFAVANHYRGLLTGFVIDEMDSQLIESVRGLNIQVHVTKTLMKGLEDRRQVAGEILNFIGEVI